MADAVIKHWLLNLAVEMPVWLRSVIPEVRSQALNVKPVPHCGATDYAEALIELLDSGMITMSSEFPEDDVETRFGIGRILDRFLALPEDVRQVPIFSWPHSSQVSFKMTALGGEAWEGIAEPDWTHILTESSDLEVGELFSPNRDLLMAYMGWYGKLSSSQIQFDTVSWQTHSNFEILYWKRLPLVHHASFSLQPVEGKFQSWPTWFYEWFFAKRWHKDPWDLPGWPLE